VESSDDTRFISMLKTMPRAVSRVRLFLLFRFCSPFSFEYDNPDVPNGIHAVMTKSRLTKCLCEMLKWAEVASCIVKLG
jgi:hypothetical protein